ncbi:MAG: hypothetical protein NWT04_07910 [Verrucomicrobiales bacterium]|nr:hypothetical protein [Verrucomicrobiales bacterium]
MKVLRLFDRGNAADDIQVNPPDEGRVVDVVVWFYPLLLQHRYDKAIKLC